MTERSVDVFFYGLFMDSEVLRESQVLASNPRRAFLHGHELRIGRRAAVVPAPGGRVCGVVFALSHDAIERLYAAPGLELYRPEAVLVHPVEGEPIPALCYNLRDAPGPEEANPEYAGRLRAVLSKLEFPSEYIESIA